MSDLSYAFAGESYPDTVAAISPYIGVPTSLAQALFAAESNWDPNATNPVSGAMGIGQVLPSTAADPGYGLPPLANAYDPAEAIPWSLAYLNALYGAAGSWTGALLRYYPGAASDPNYASAFAAAEQADAAAGNTPSLAQRIGAAFGYSPSVTATAGTPWAQGYNAMSGAPIATSPTTTAIGNTIQSAGGFAWLTQRAPLVILGIGLIVVGGLAMAFRGAWEGQIPGYKPATQAGARFVRHAAK